MASVYTLSVIAAWYLSNVCVILLNKYLLSNYGFRYPVFLTMMHMLMCALLSMAAHASGVVRKQAIKGRTHAIKIAVLAVVFVVSVVCGNISLRFIPVSFNQAIGAITPFFSALLSLLITRRKESTKTYITLVPIVLGIIIASKAEPQFHSVGFVTCLSAAFARALKGVLQGLLLTNDDEKLDSNNLLMYMSPVALFVLVASTIFMEPDAFGIFYQNCLNSSRFVFILTLNCILAFNVNLTNFLVTKCTSPLTLQVLGNAKGAVAVVASIIVFRNPVSSFAIVGYGITIAGLVTYSNANRRGKKAARL
ncbi:Drug/Metabolite transporter superfamily [Micromonas commoda]|uniref:Drug/Metabolite transporter superfamily n=1 Tax=Micromonas commoda (strain RCC299 / NOUM17 / CCMP2709) TaxID=296587 RepID=C1EJI2_MICCC|nr:Drug/Metabolite transporter superfamily [Micromonas commoda]ACO68237.1 Drug/Metabolite transporter superfamily [Micromonas commoda]|eukprot:XP_002506979.1 Drug/Metabolite transporter superfamily [Micromonas commoda]